MNLTLFFAGFRCRGEGYDCLNLHCHTLESSGNTGRAFHRKALQTESVKNLYFTFHFCVGKIRHLKSRPGSMNPGHESKLFATFWLTNKFSSGWSSFPDPPLNGNSRAPKITRTHPDRPLENRNLHIRERNMSTADILYLSMLLGSIPYGHLVKISGTPARKQLLCTAAGICLSIALVGFWGILHSFVTILGTYLIVISLGQR